MMNKMVTGPHCAPGVCFFDPEELFIERTGGELKLAAQAIA